MDYEIVLSLGCVSLLSREMYRQEDAHCAKNNYSICRRMTQVGKRLLFFWSASLILVEDQIFLDSDILQPLRQHGFNKIRFRSRLLYGNRQPYIGSAVSSDEFIEGKCHAFTCHG